MPCKFQKWSANDVNMSSFGIQPFGCFKSGISLLCSSILGLFVLLTFPKIKTLPLVAFFATCLASYEPYCSTFSLCTAFGRLASGRPVATINTWQSCAISKSLLHNRKRGPVQVASSSLEQTRRCTLLMRVLKRTLMPKVVWNDCKYFK